MEEGSFLFKIVLIGNAGVGKTCLVRQFTQGKFPARSGATIGVDFLLKPMVVKETKVNLQIWDTAGQERFRSITQSYYRSAHCLVLVYDISSQPSFDSLQQWSRDIEHFTGASATGTIANSTNPVLRVLVGNKCDKEREIPHSVGQHFADSNQFDLFLETSALALENVDRLFVEIATILVERKLASQNAGTSGKRNQLQSAHGDGGSGASESQGFSFKSLLSLGVGNSLGFGVGGGGGGGLGNDDTNKQRRCC